MSAAEFIINNKIDLFKEHGRIEDKIGNTLVENPDCWMFYGNDGHSEKVYLQ